MLFLPTPAHQYFTLRCAKGRYTLRHGTVIMLRSRYSDD